MDSVNIVLNRINTWSNPEVKPFKRIVGTRLTNLVVTVPLEIGVVAKNILLVPVYAGSTIFKGLTKVVALITNSQDVKKFEAKLPGFSDLLRSIAKIFAFTIGAALTATLGVLSPKANFAVHCGLGLITDLKLRKTLKDELQAIELKKMQIELDAKYEAEKIAKEIRAKEQEELNNLTHVYKEAKKIENEVKHSINDKVTPLVEKVIDETKQAVHQAVEEIKEIEEESKEFFQETESMLHDAEINLENEFELDEIYETADSTLSKVYSSTINNGKALVNGTIHTIAHPVQSTKNVINYATSFFVTQPKKV